MQPPSDRACRGRVARSAVGAGTRPNHSTGPSASASRRTRPRTGREGLGCAKDGRQQPPTPRDEPVSPAGRAREPGTCYPAPESRRRHHADRTAQHDTEHQEHFPICVPPRRRNGQCDREAVKPPPLMGPSGSHKSTSREPAESSCPQTQVGLRAMRIICSLRMTAPAEGE